MSQEFEQISLKPGFMKHNGGVLFRNISDTEYEFKSTINTLSPFLAQFTAELTPLGPAPITITSYFLLFIKVANFYFHSVFNKNVTRNNFFIIDKHYTFLTRTH